VAADTLINATGLSRQLERLLLTAMPVSVTILRNSPSRSSRPAVPRQ
jgi:hypothetical protein